TVKSGAGKDSDEDDDENDDDDDKEEVTAKDDKETKETGKGGDEVREKGAMKGLNLSLRRHLPKVYPWYLLLQY
nr:hypothetical protein [Tanacetum cinerariifolium]